MEQDEDTETRASVAEQEAEAEPPADDPTGSDEPVEAAETSASGDSDDGEAAGADGAGAAETSAGTGQQSAGPQSPVGDDLVDRVSEYDDGLAQEVQSLVNRAFELRDESRDLHDRVEELESEVESLRAERNDFKQRLVRKQADFKNYKERAKKKQDQIRERATEDLVERIVPVRDNLVRALDQEEGADIRDGIEATLRDFNRVLEDENVEEVSPESGEEVDPQRHEVMVRVDSDEPEGAIVDVYRPGYEMGGKVIQTAQVTVSNGSDYDPASEAVALDGDVDEGADDGTESKPVGPGESATADGGSDGEPTTESTESADEEETERSDEASDAEVDAALGDEQ
ncbi:nucleotide exchange factor GrpE [Haloarchaeobius sp. TZWWS8]|uniref:nucleotide exchange factor GrpE n=1 Tax=Haloarchaeobius sp. TZWWS8 TaxID=3446121 RepID=UPI003EB6BB86